MILHHGTKQHGTPRRQRGLEGQRLRHGRQKPGTVWYYIMAPSNMGPLADSVDWRDKGYVTAVKNQVQYDITSWHQATWGPSPTAWTGGTKATSRPSKTRYSMILHHGTKQHGTPRRQRRLEGQRLRHGRQKPGTVWYYIMAPSNMGPLADSVDWRDKGYVTAVKNQVQYDITSWHQATWGPSPTAWTGGTKATSRPSKTRYSMILHHGTKQHGTPRRQRRLEGQRLRHGRQKPGTVWYYIMAPSNMGPLADSVDWRDKGYVTAVKNQVSPSYRLLVLLLQHKPNQRSNTQSKREVPRGVRNSKVRRQDKFRRDWSRH